MVLSITLSGKEKDLGISSKKPLYVVDIDSRNNNVMVGDKQDIYASEFMVTDLNWIAFDSLAAPMTVKTKIRYLHPETEAVIVPIEQNNVSVKFTEAQMAITPGQAAVFYDGEIVIGGGTIERVLH